MSAICGVFNLDRRPATRDTVSVMSRALAHRGSDAAGDWCAGSVALAHRLRQTTPESLTETQPVVLVEAGVVLVADARIDNREDLISCLGLRRAPAPSDSEIIVAAYLRWHQQCPNRLIGDFAFALWNIREQSLFCARDIMGAKPFYYTGVGKRFAFATEVKALLALPGMEAAVDAEQVAMFLGWNHDDRVKTMLRDIVRLPAAHSLLVTTDRTSLRRYWAADSAPDVRFARDEEYAEAFRDCLTNAVQARLRCAHPVGATLSGGLDSSSVVCLSHQLRLDEASPLHTFSVVFSDLPERDLRLIDERSFIDAVVRSRPGLQPHFVPGEAISPIGDIRRVSWHLDEPHSAPNLYLHWAMYQSAEQNGVRVLLDGFDGDTTVSHGFGRLTGLTRAEQWNTLESEIKAFCASHHRSPDRALHEYVLPHLAELARGGRFVQWSHVASQLARRFALSRGALAVRYGLCPLLPAWLRGLTRATHHDSRLERSLLNSKLAKALRRHDRQVALTGFRRPVATERQAHLEGLSQPLYQLTLEVADKSAAAFGIEPRYPFFDRRLIEFCVGLPEDQKFRGGWPRLILRRAMNGILPSEIQWRASKANLSPNFHRRFHAFDIAQRSTSDNRPLTPYLRTDRVDRLMSEYRTSKDVDGQRQEALTLFRAITLQAWLDQLSNRGHRERSDAGALSSVAA